MQLEDNRHYFPPYDAAPVARAETLLRYPQVRTALEGLAGRITADDMRAMNYAADVEHRDIAGHRARVSGQIGANQRCRPPSKPT